LTGPVVALCAGHGALLENSAPFDSSIDPVNVAQDLPDTMPADNRTAPRVTNHSAAYDPALLSYGLYWFGKDQANQKFVAGEANAYFDPTKPTLIFAHGWQPYISDELPDFDFNGNDTVAAWIDDAWNVGIFVWNQFADETTGVALGGAWFTDGPPEGVLDAEAKIWTPNGPRQMRWRDWSEPIWEDGYKSGPDKSAGQLFYETYIAALDGYTGTIRIAGHSLGNQMAVRLTKLVDDAISAGEVAADLRPARVALLDPYWSPAPRNDLVDSDVAGRKTGDVVREYIADLLPTGTLFEWYWSSEWTTPDEGDANDALKPMVLYAEMAPQYALNGLQRHMAPRYLYFWAYTFPQDPPCSGTDDACRLLGQMSDAQLTMLAGTHWQQVAGQTTATPSDDLYTATQTTTETYTLTSLHATPTSQTVGDPITVTATVTGSDDPTPDGVQVTFDTDLGTISTPVATSNGFAVSYLTSDKAGPAHITATLPGGAWASVTVTFTAPSLVPTVGFDAMVYAVEESDGSAPITVTLHNPPTQTVTVDYATANGDALAGEDYVTTSGTLTFATGTTNLTFSVPITDDDEVEWDETVKLMLRDPTNAELSTPYTATLIIDDDDVPAGPIMQFSDAAYVVREDAGSATVTTTLQNPPTQTVSVNYMTLNGTAIAGSDYITASGTLTFPVGTTWLTFTVPITDDNLVETDETLTLTLRRPVNSTLGLFRTATLTILDDDEAMYEIYLPLVVRD
jgi:hypothetical protein